MQYCTKYVIGQLWDIINSASGIFSPRRLLKKSLKQSMVYFSVFLSISTLVEASMFELGILLVP